MDKISVNSKSEAALGGLNSKQIYKNSLIEKVQHPSRLSLRDTDVETRSREVNLNPMTIIVRSLGSWIFKLGFHLAYDFVKQNEIILR